MRQEFSAYLDLVRLSAALLVLCAHLTFPAMTGGIVPYQGELAGYGVTAFFVLSGFVISYVADQKEHTLKSFAVSRMARIYSVALPALFLTIAIDLVTLHHAWDRNVPLYEYVSFPRYFLLAITFTGYAGAMNYPAFGNSVFWSLDYEVWYYVIFAAAFYYGGMKRNLLVGLLLVLSGPRIAILFPMWLLGVWIYKVQKTARLGPSAAIALFAGSIVLAVLFRIFAIDVAIDSAVNAALGGWPVRFLSNSQHFPGHYIFALFVGMNIFAARYMRLDALSGRAGNVIRYGASFTFVLYLTHYPLLSFYSQIFHHDSHSLGSVLLLVTGTLVSVWLLGFITEHRKSEWKRLFANVLTYVNAVLMRHAPVLRRALLPG